MKYMKEKRCMKIDIIKKEDGEIVFCIDKEEYKFEYEALDKLIERVYNNDAEVTYETTEELKEYEELLKGIVIGARKEDYREAVRKAKEASEKLESEEQNEII